MIRVVGKVVPENIFALVGNETLRANPIFHQTFLLNKTMLSAYRAQDWNGVEVILPQIEELFEELKLDLNLYLALYSTRVADMRAVPPPEDWDGVFSSTKK